MPLAITTTRRIVPTRSGGVARVGMIGRYNSLGRAGIMCSEATTNLITNPVLGGGTTGYTATASTIALSDEWAQWGRYSLKVTTSNAGATEGVYYDVTGYTAGSATTYSVDLYGRGTVVLRIDDGVGTTDSAAITLSTTPQRKYVTRTLDAGASRCRCMVLTNSQQLAVFHTDGWQCATLGWATPLASGSNADAPFSGTAHASTSVRTAPTLYHAVANIGDAFTAAFALRTAPAWRTTAAEHTICEIYNGADNKNRVLFALDHNNAGNGGKTHAYIYDVAAGQSDYRGAVLTPDTDYVLFLVFERTNATQTTVKTYYALMGATGSTADISQTATRVRQAETARLYINSLSSSSWSGNHVMYWWAIIPDVALTQTQIDAYVATGANPPYTGTRYYGGSWLGYDAEELGESVHLLDDHYALLHDGYAPAPPEEDEPGKLITVTEEATFRITGTSAADLDERVAAIERVLGEARSGRECWMYAQPRGGQQLRAHLLGGGLELPDEWNSWPRTAFKAHACTLTLTREPLWRGQEQQLYEDRSITNYSATVLASPIPIFNPGDEPAPLRLTWENTTATGWNLVEYAIARRFGTPANPLYDLNGTAHANALSGEHGAVASMAVAYAVGTQVASQAMAVDANPRNYVLILKVASTDVTKALDFAAHQYHTGTVPGEARSLLGAERTGVLLTTNNILQRVMYGVVRFPREGARFGDDSQAVTLKVYGKVASAAGAPDVSVDYIRLLECDTYGYQSLDATYTVASIANRIVWDSESGVVEALDSGGVTGNVDDPYIVALTGAPFGVPPMLQPGWNNLCVWARGAAENEHDVACKVGGSVYVPRYRSVKGSV